jgi:NAD+ synthase (glutamine-hydrolysing)
VRRIAQATRKDEIAKPSDLANRLFVTMYMGTDNSSSETAERSNTLAKEVGAYHLSFPIDVVVESLLSLFQTVTG